jgi:hypothetical protein
MRSIKLMDAYTVQLACVAAFFASCAPGAVAAASVSDVLACRGIADNAVRLACFDRESERLAPASASAATVPQSAGVQASSTAAAAQTPPVAAANTPAAAAAAPALDPQRTFGLSSAELSAREVAAGQRPREVASITAHIRRLDTAANGRVIFTLDDDQVWQQLLAEGGLDAKPGEAVEISRGLFGSYWLKAQSGRGCKVRRLR